MRPEPDYYDTRLVTKVSAFRIQNNFSVAI